MRGSEPAVEIGRRDVWSGDELALPGASGSAGTNPRGTVARSFGWHPVSEGMVANGPAWRGSMAWVSLAERAPSMSLPG